MTRWTFLTTLIVALAMATACGGAVEPDDGTDDAGTADAGTSDAGTPDAGTPDAGTPDGGGASCSNFIDTCGTPPPGYVQIDCKKRWMYGVNWAWSSTPDPKPNEPNNANVHFGTDFGGFEKWGQPGVTADRAQRKIDMQAMKDHGVNTIRWWMFPNFVNTDGIAWDANNMPTGLGRTTAEDIETALELAEEVGVHLQLTLFSFDNFKTADAASRNMAAYLPDSAKRAAIIEKIVKPVAMAVESSPYKHRMVSWDVINEPEWAISGSDGYGDESFSPDTSVITPVPFVQMETFVREVVTALHSINDAPVTVGGAAIKWAKAWSKVGLDHYNYHYYGWVHRWFPVTDPISKYIVTDKPVVMGEFPLRGIDDVCEVDKNSNGKCEKDEVTVPGIDYPTLMSTLWRQGWAGAMGWAFTEASEAYSWENNKANVKAFADQKGCMVRY